jgi:SAM-dependent methyltransferase
MDKSNINQLTEQEFWKNYWENLQLPSQCDENFSFDRCLSKAILKQINKYSKLNQVGNLNSVLEIGAAPGKWLSIFPKNSFSVSGIEYNQLGVDALRQNLKLLGIEPLELIYGDFFELEPRQDFDIVMSLGFIEHFKDPVTVIRRHIDWLRPGGILIIGVPNFTGLHGIFQRILDKSIYDAHNTAVMSKKFFESLPTILKIEKLSFEYLGSFEPALPMTYQKKNLHNFIPKGILRLASYLRRWRKWDSLNSPFISSYLLATYQKSE